MHLSHAEYQPPVFPDIQRRRKIPSGRYDVNDLLANPAQLPIEAPRVLDVLKRMGTEHSLKLAIGERQAINAVQQYEVSQLGVLRNVGIDAATVSLAAADIQVPTLARDDRPLQAAVAVPVQENDYCRNRRCKRDEIPHRL